MEWWVTLIVYFSGLVLLLMLGVPVAFSFLTVNLAGMYVFMGGPAGWGPMTLNIYQALTNFVLVAVVGFVFMGEILSQSGVFLRTIEAIDVWVGRIPGRLGILTILAGALFGALSGAAIASVAMLTTLMLPEMRRRGYSKSMYLGTIMGSGQLDGLIPPSNLMIILGGISNISTGALLIGGVGPGVLLSAVFIIYILVTCSFAPSLAPPYTPDVLLPLVRKLILFVRDVLPLGIIVMLAMGIIFFGIATPSEASATGALAAVLLTLGYRRLRFQLLKQSIINTARVSVMVLMIVSGSISFTQFMGMTGAITRLINFVADSGMTPGVFVIGAMVIILILGCFVDQISILMITVPILVPVAEALGIDTVWFGVLMIIATQMGVKTPPFGIFPGIYCRSPDRRHIG